MKKFLKVSSIVLGVLVAVLIGVLSGAFVLDHFQTRYLELSHHSGAKGNSYLIKNVNVIAMTADTVLAQHMVLIQDGMIAEVAPEITRTDIEEIDGKGGFLSPGLVDMHVHVWDEYELGLYLAHGVTAVRNLWGQPMHLRMKEALAKEELVGPVFFTSGPKLTGPEFIGDDNLQLNTPEEARAKVVEYKERGYDFIKTYYGLTGPLLDAILDESRGMGYDVVAHPTPMVDYSFHFRPGIVTVEHAEEIVQQALKFDLDTAKLNAVMDSCVAYPEATLCPTLVVFHNIYRLMTVKDILSPASLDYMNPLIRMVDSQAQYDRWTGSKAEDSTVVARILEQHQWHMMAVRGLHERGVNIVAGTDAGIGVTPPGLSMHQELAFYVEAGMSPFEALQTATINPSYTHDFLKNMGSIQEGKMANLVLTQENPLDNLATLSNPEQVWVRGRSYDQESLALFKEKAQHRSNMLVSALRYLENLLREK
jgi:hypothetical protein